MIIDVIITAAIALVIGGALFYIIRAKKKGKKCIGCPSASTCPSNCSCKSKKTEK